MKQALDDEKLGIEHLIALLLKEPKIREKISEGFAEHRRDHWELLVIKDTAKIRFGKYSWSGFSGIWNNLIKCYEEISFTDFFIKVWDALVDMTAGTDSNIAVIEGLSREILLEGIKNKKYNWIADRLFDVCRHLTAKGYWNPEGTKAKLSDAQRGRDSGTVEIEVNRQHAPVVNYRVVDSVGDVFEIVGMRWLGGHK